MRVVEISANSLDEKHERQAKVLYTHAGNRQEQRGKNETTADPTMTDSKK